jgi:hypothetical protein
MRKQGSGRRKKQRRKASGFLIHIPVFLLVNYYIYFNNISTNARQVLFNYTLVVTTPDAYGYNPVLILPLPDLAGNAVLVWYSMLKAHPMILVDGISLGSYHGTPKLGVLITRPGLLTCPPFKLEQLL